MAVTVFASACQNEVVAEYDETDPGFDKVSFCDANPSSNGCCLEERDNRIDFEDIANATVAPIGMRYDTKGVNFQSGSGRGTMVVAEGHMQMGATSGQNAVLFGIGKAPLRISFKNPKKSSLAVTSRVTVQVGDRSDETDMLIMFAYNRGGKLLGSDTVITQPSGKKGDKDFGELSIEADSILTVVVHDTSSSGAALDDLSFGCLKYIGR